LAATADPYACHADSVHDGVVKVLLLSHVCVGDAIKGTRAQKVPPRKSGDHLPYDSYVNDLNHPGIVVTTMDGQGLPLVKD